MEFASGLVRGLAMGLARPSAGAPSGGGSNAKERALEIEIECEEAERAEPASLSVTTRAMPAMMLAAIAKRAAEIWRRRRGVTKGRCRWTAWRMSWLRSGVGSGLCN